MSVCQCHLCAAKQLLSLLLRLLGSFKSVRCISTPAAVSAETLNKRVVQQPKDSILCLTREMHD